MPLNSVQLNLTFLVKGAFLMSAFSVYIDNVVQPRSVLGSGFYLTVVAWLCAWANCAACAYQKSQSTSGKGGDDPNVVYESSSPAPHPVRENRGASNATYEG